MIIDLDDPAPRWFRCCGALAAILVVALMIAPWIIEASPATDTTEGPAPRVEAAAYATICQPAVDFPAFAEPALSMALPSWMRLCDWFADPSLRPVAVPTESVTGPDFED